MKVKSFIVLIFAVVTLTYGCSKEYVMVDSEGNVLGTPETKYTVLSFFFDGVPNPALKKAEEGEKTNGGANGGDTKPRGSVHGPYAAKFCDGCHERQTNALVLPLQELCYKCHQLNIQKRYIHGPLAAGGCSVCHDPHSSSNKFLLVSRAENFCFYCHDEKAVAKNPAHADAPKECTACHNAHASDKKYLLN